MQTIDLGYRPREQFVNFHKRTKRWSSIVAHRRCGKTVACVGDLIDAAYRCDKPDPRFAYVAPFYSQAKDIAWSYLRRFTAADSEVRTFESELRVDLPARDGSTARLRLYGADNYERLRGVYFDGVILDEYGDMDPRAWSEVIRPALSDRQGWAVFIGTPKGRNHFWELWDQAQGRDDWFTLRLRASDTGIIPPPELADAKLSMSDDQYAQEYECSFDAAVIGSYYGKLMDTADADGRVTSVPHAPELQVYTWWDLGIDDATAIWFVQQAGRDIRVIDYYENSGAGLEHYAALLRSKPYVYADRGHFLPHDVEVTELGTGKSRFAFLAGLGVRGTVVPRLEIEDGINAVRRILPRCWFDKTKCAHGLEALRQYRKEWDDRLKAFKQRPLHDWSSHAADAFRYGAVMIRERAPGSIRPTRAAGLD